MKNSQETVLKMAIEIKKRMPNMDDKECGRIAKELYIETLKTFAKSCTDEA